MTQEELSIFARRYAEAWCSRDPGKVAAFYAKNATIRINNGPPAPIAEVVREFAHDFPDMLVTFDKLKDAPNGTEFHWTLTGTHRDSGNRVRISGYELWKIDNDGLVAESLGHFDAADYARQLSTP